MSRNIKVKHKIQYVKKVDAIVLVAVFIMFIVLIIGLWFTTQQYKDKQYYVIKDTMEIISDNQKSQFKDYINDKISSLQALATFTEIKVMNASRQERFIKGRSEKFGFHHIFVMDMEGVGHYFEEGMTRNQKDEPFFENVMNNHVYITEPFYAEYEAFVTVCVSIFNNDKKVGVLCGAVELSTMRNLFVETRTVINGDMILVNKEGLYIASKDMQQVYNKDCIFANEEDDYSIVKAAFDEKKDKTGIIIRDGKEYQAHVTYLKDYKWVIVQSIENDEIYKELQSLDMWTYFSIVIVLAILALVMRIAMYWRRSEKRINTDTLTGCYSRLAMENLIEKLEKNKHHQVTVTYMDLNKFKLINDTYGHDMGDVVLCTFSRVLMEIFAKKGNVGRMGGDEFMIILLDFSEEKLIELCEKIGERLKEESDKLELKHIISASYGFATRQKGSVEPLSTFINAADEKMYIYKEEHR